MISEAEKERKFASKAGVLALHVAVESGGCWIFAKVISSLLGEFCLSWIFETFCEIPKKSRGEFDLGLKRYLNIG